MQIQFHNFNRHVSRVVCCLLAVVPSILFISCSSKVAHRSFLVPPIRGTPADVGLNYQEVIVECGDKKLLGWLVIAATNPDSASNGVILFSGIGGGVSNWINVQRTLYDNHISSLVVNYGDLRDTLTYEENESSTSFADIECAIPKFFNELAGRTPTHSSFFFLGHSMGCAVLSQHYSLLDTSRVKGLIFCSQFSSLRASARHYGWLPKIFLFMIPDDIFNNTVSVPRIHTPLLIVHSKADSVNLYEWSEDVFRLANEPKTLVSYEQFDHKYIYKGTDDFWQPIIRFIKEAGER